MGGVPGDFPPLPDQTAPQPTTPAGPTQWVIRRQPGGYWGWDLLSQRWTCQLVPATGPNLVKILQTTPTLPDSGTGGVTLPNLGALSDADVGCVSPH